MIDHFGITVSNLERSTEFYIKTLGALGYTLIKSNSGSVSFGVRDGHGQGFDPGGDFWVSQGAPMNPRVHFAFSAASSSVVDDFFSEGLAAGGTGNGEPGLRPQFHPHYYAAFLLDPDGYNIEAVCHTE